LHKINILTLCCVRWTFANIQIILQHDGMESVKVTVKNFSLALSAFSSS
jgi:hypothetical protein